MRPQPDKAVRFATLATLSKKKFLRISIKYELKQVLCRKTGNKSKTF